MKISIPFVKSHPNVAVIRLSGTIRAGARGALSDEATAPLIEKAFARGKPRAVALLINSPGGSPAQSALIARRIRRLADDKGVPVHAFVEDVAASGGYWLACAGDDIWVDATSIVGSIGVIFSGFGFHEFINRHGIERRVHTAGKSKSMLDPFKPEKPADVKRVKEWGEQIHEVFIDHVKQRRGERLNGGDELFSGEIFVGSNAVETGLADGVAHVVPKMKELYGDKVRFRTYGPKKGLFQRLGRAAVGDALAEIEDRAAFARFGL